MGDLEIVLTDGMETGCRHPVDRHLSLSAAEFPVFVDIVAKRSPPNCECRVATRLEISFDGRSGAWRGRHGVYGGRGQDPIEAIVQAVINHDNCCGLME